ncbi:MAG: hypothetical protein R2847_03345 [Bacteroidia bacterium]
MSCLSYIKDEHFKNVIRKTVDFIISAMTDAEGYFYSSMNVMCELVKKRQYYCWNCADMEKVNFNNPFPSKKISITDFDV